MSREKDNTTATAAATTVQPLNGQPYASADVFHDLADDFAQGVSIWREVPQHFAQYVREVITPIEGPEGSGSYALGELCVRRRGAVCCVVAVEGGRYFTKYCDLLEWSEELLALRDALARMEGEQECTPWPRNAPKRRSACR